MFATLDATTRKLALPQNGTECVVTDTVGFIAKLPTQLVSAFRSTLEEVEGALCDQLGGLLDATAEARDA